jgi:hypothetical protein
MRSKPIAVSRALDKPNDQPQRATGSSNAPGGYGINT